MSNYKDYINDDNYRGGYRYPAGTKRMKIDEEATKNAISKELEEMACEMAKLMDAAGIDIFEYSITSPQRKYSWSMSATSLEETWNNKSKSRKEA